MEPCRPKRNHTGQWQHHKSDGEAKHSKTERPIPFQANFQRGMAPPTLVQLVIVQPKARTPKAKPRDTWAAVFGETIYPAGSDPSAYCGKMPGRVQGRVALGPKDLGDTSSDFCSLTNPCNLK